MASPYGRQPAADELKRHQLTVGQAATSIGVDHVHLGRAVRGYVRPNFAVRQQLPALVRRPLRKLFTDEALEPSQPHKPHASHDGHGHDNTHTAREACRRAARAEAGQ